MRPPSWIPAQNSPWRNTLAFFSLVCGLIVFAATTCGTVLTLAPTPEGRIKIVVFWAFGVSAAGAFAAWRLLHREHTDTRYGRVLEPLHAAHHKLRDVAFARYIEKQPDEVWRELARLSLVDFAGAFSAAVGARVHATVKVIKPPTGVDRRQLHASDYLVETFVRSEARSPKVRVEGDVVTIGKNTDFRQIFDTGASEDTSCWYSNDLLALELYHNQHWPQRPTCRNVAYRSTMVWPIRKVLREAAPDVRPEHYVWGFLTIDMRETGLLNYDRHFHIGAAYADHLMSTLWNAEHARTLWRELSEVAR